MARSMRGDQHIGDDPERVVGGQGLALEDAEGRNNSGMTSPRALSDLNLSS